MQKELNKDVQMRDVLIFGRYRPKMYEHGGIRRFEGMTRKTLWELLLRGFIDPEDTQNLAPSVKEIYDFMRRNRGYTCHGYAVSVDRDDYRVSIEGVCKGEPAKSPEEFQDFKETFKYADEFNPSIMWCWFD